MDLKTSLDTFPGIGPARAKALKKLGLETVGDLLSYYPRAYEDRTKTHTISNAPADIPVCVSAMVAEAPSLSRIRKGLNVTKCRIVDHTGSAQVTFFNQDYVRHALEPGESYIFYGRLEVMGRHRQFTNPVFEREDRTRFTGRIMPVYPLTAGVSNNLLAGLALPSVEECARLVPDQLPEEICRSHELCGAEYACRNVHFPADTEALAVAKRRLVFEELFFLSCGMSFLRRRRSDAAGRSFPSRSPEEFLSLLPFPPTGAQRRAMGEIAADLSSGKPMNRLVQGDVGSGKTAVAAYAAWVTHAAGAQTALMAPTEILAHQHFETLTKLLAPARIVVGLLTGSMKAAEKKSVKEALARGDIHLVVGTHALLSEGVEYADLGLVVTDEQHRFGVGQRSALSSKARTAPHVLVMSATPIPRTLALLIYGDLDVTVIDELPPGRTPVETYLVGEDKRQRMYNFVRKNVSQGRQVYIICPAVEEGEGSDLKAVTAYAKTLSERVFPDLRVAFVHGKMKGKDKEAVMSAFSRGEIQVLVSTTVVEVGVDVPNAALMIIENAERFGLSQLHQLRGRVGRGQWKSFCVLVTGNRSQETLERLRYFTKTTDGFKIAEKDLELRGPGDFFGRRQHGLPTLQAADLAGDTRVLKEAQEAAGELLETDPDLRAPEHQTIKEKVRRLFAEDGDIFN
ncbi:MAG: ATP-dependent DNA helicase RecG [Oscillospiraceae bacterium]|nr:ATP-dependent DNA helicase RecG [Oscillospiraceae bacterium]